MISKRLKRIAEYTKGFKALADVACDHGLLAKYALEENYVSYAFLIDIAKEPLESARNNLSKANLLNKTTFILSDGLKEFNDDADCFVISGIGTETIIKILTENFTKFLKAKRLIISSHKDTALLRRFVTENGLAIKNEEIIKDKFFYEVLILEKGLMGLTEKEIFFGPILLRNPSMEFIEFYQSEFKKLISFKKLNEKTEKRFLMIKELLEEIDLKQNPA